MKIKVNTASCKTPQACPLFCDIDIDRMNSEVAEMCRRTWRSRDWSTYWALRSEEFDKEPPPIPAGDSAVIALYFDEDQEESEGTEPSYEIVRGSTMVDLSAPYEIGICITDDLTVFRKPPTQQKGSFTDNGAGYLGRVMINGASDLYTNALTEFIAALTARGFPVHLPEFTECVLTVCEARQKQDE